MAFDFPASPAVDDVFTDATTGASYKWSGEKWLRQPDAVVTFDSDADIRVDESPEATIERMKAQHEKEE
jgi:hypothetical protein